ncbi:MAG: 50S ribosomal protein L18 [Spirochaetales bacterium]|nr:50S ribosomal protein L18 [Spirochaetales bacterium]
MKHVKEKIRRRVRRKIGIRKKIKGTEQCPRLSIYKSNKNVYLQVIDDIAGNTLVSASTLEKDLRKIKTTVKEAGKLGEVIGQRMKDKKISRIVFDRNGYKYHGVVKAIADAARKTGIQF